MTRVGFGGELCFAQGGPFHTPVIYFSTCAQHGTQTLFLKTILEVSAEASRPDPPGFGSRHPKCQHESWS